MAPMTPDTVHLIAQLIRHHRGMATVFEKWVLRQPLSPDCQDVIRVIAGYRNMLTLVEDHLSKVEVSSTQDAEPAFRQ